MTGRAGAMADAHLVARARVAAYLRAVEPPAAPEDERRAAVILAAAAMAACGCRDCSDFLAAALDLARSERSPEAPAPD